MLPTTPKGFRALPLPVVQLSLPHVLKCGQAFRWTSYPLPATESPHAHEYRLCLTDRVVCLRQSPDHLFYRAVFPGDRLSEAQEQVRDQETLAWIKDYFQLDVDLVKLYDQWGERDQVFNKLKSRFAGIRMLRQDPWETLVSFICSSNNNIPRITGMLHALCRYYSPSLITLPPPSEISPQGPTMYHPFPPPSVLAAPGVKSTLRALGFGYRADYVHRTAKVLVDAHGSSTSSTGIRESCEEWLIGLRQMNTENARVELLKFVGVGRKVADCVLLMSLDKKEVVPVDTHVYQIAVKHYGLRTKGGSKAKSTMTPRVYEQVTTKLVEIWGEYAGWAHSVVFTADLKPFSSSDIQSPAPEATIDDANVLVATTTANANPSIVTTTRNADTSAVSLPSLPSLKRTHTEMQQTIGMHDWETRRRVVVAVVALAAFAVSIYAQTLLSAGDDDLSWTDDDDLDSADDDTSSPRRKRRRES